jgi:peroxiredoxin (alkyl hydroperoxide reductase subunit C)
MVLVGKKAPDFSVKAVVKGLEIKENFKLSDFLGKYVVLFFYPLDFTYVCPTELHAFQDKLPEFEKRNVQIIAVSTDSWHSHLAWLNTPKKQGGIQGITYPIVSDFNKTISRDYDVLLDTGMALRGLFLIDTKGVVQHQVVNQNDLGRNVAEALRIVDAQQFSEKHGEVCPANWNAGNKGLKKTAEGLKAYFS